MGGHLGAPVSAALQLEPTVTIPRVHEALASWLQTVYGVPLEAAEKADLVVEWRTAEEDTPFACQLVVSDSSDQTRRTVTVLSDEVGAAAILEEDPLAARDAPHAAIDLSESLRSLLEMLIPITPSLITLRRGELNQFDTVDPTALLEVLQDELAPGLLIAVTAGPEASPSPTQHALLDRLSGLAVVGSAPVGAELFRELGAASPPRVGSIVSIARTSAGLDPHVVPSVSLRAKVDSARRLIVRRQLSAPIPFSLERRRSAAMKRVVTSGHELDLSAALELMDEESQRASKLDSRVKDLETQLERAFEEQDSALSALDDALSRLRYLERAFRDLGEVPTVEADVDDDWRPESSAEALMAAKELFPFLVISAERDGCDTLDGQQKRGIWAKKIWLALRALNDYCRAKSDGRFSGDIAMYRDNPPDRAIPLLADYAPMESESTANIPHLRAIRTFNVPPTVEPTGKIYMGQHLKIDRGGQSAPRIHLYDQSDAPSQRIYIGYIGPHLPTSSSF